jgi:glycosyltransferase involved in cell wall biosynthesis
MSQQKHVPVSAYMITFNNERTLENALKSLDWVDEIVVVDSFSTDRTPEIARKYAAKWEQRTWPGFREQYQYASEQCTHDWILFIDADEEISPALRAEMQAELRRNAARPEEQRVRGYHAPRRTYYLGRWHLHGAWVPDREIRLYQRQYGQWQGGLHASVQVDGPTTRFRHFYYHYTYENIADQLRTIDKYSTQAAADMAAEKKPFSYRRLIGNPIAAFFRGYFLKGGFRDGLPGFIVAVTTTFYVFIKYAKLWESGQHFPEFGDRDQLP